MSRHHDKIPSRQWQLLRLRVFERDGWRCVDCGRAGRLECDHVIPMDKGGHPTDMNNLASRCRGCHIAKTAAENRKPESPERAAWRAYLETLI